VLTCKISQPEVAFPMARAGLFATAVFTFVFAWLALGLP
jgi:ABC-type glycerol-3-phosphate transport system permease component